MIEATDLREALAVLAHVGVALLLVVVEVEDGLGDARGAPDAVAPALELVVHAAEDLTGGAGSSEPRGGSQVPS